MTEERGPTEGGVGTRNAVETGIELAKHLGGGSWEQALPRDRSIRPWPEPPLGFVPERGQSHTNEADRRANEAVCPG